MAETGNWIVPQYDYGKPFWAKPPLSMWMSALGMKVFGINEFGSRIFIFSAALLVVAMTAWLALNLWDFSASLLAAFALTSMPLFF